jgi:hypothetical protein
LQHLPVSYNFVPLPHCTYHPIFDSTTDSLKTSNMHRAWPSLLLASTCVSVAQAIYSIQTDYTGAKFFDGFDFFTDADPTNGNVKFLDETTANATGLAGFLDLGNGASAIYMAADSTSIVPENSGRSSVRVSSQQTFQHGLVIIDIQHMPTGKSTGVKG